MTTSRPRDTDDAARAQAHAALRVAQDAERRAAKAEREYLELAATVRGEPRRLSRAELAQLRSAGPSGPALLAAALMELANARAGGGRPVALHTALTAVASAAVSWQERL